MKEALSLATHPEDAPYIALGSMLNIPIWSNDKGLKNQTKVTVCSTVELVTILDR